MRAELGDESVLTIALLEEHEVLAHDPHAQGPAIAHLVGDGNGVPVAPQQLPHQRFPDRRVRASFSSVVSISDSQLISPCDKRALPVDAKSFLQVRVSPVPEVSQPRERCEVQISDARLQRTLKRKAYSRYCCMEQLRHPHRLTPSVFAENRPPEDSRDRRLLLEA